MKLDDSILWALAMVIIAVLAGQVISCAGKDVSQVNANCARELSECKTVCLNRAKEGAK